MFCKFPYQKSTLIIFRKVRSVRGKTHVKHRFLSGIFNSSFLSLPNLTFVHYAGFEPAIMVRYQLVCSIAVVSLATSKSYL